MGEVPRTEQDKLNSECEHIWCLLSLRILVTSILRFFCFISVCQRNDDPSRITDEQVQHVEKRVGTSRKKCVCVCVSVGGRGGLVTSKGHDSTSCLGAGGEGGKSQISGGKKKELGSCPGTWLTQGLR